jgi:O-acetylhomoserine (thiol)-lyase
MTERSKTSRIIHQCREDRKSLFSDLNHPVHRNVAFSFDSYDEICNAFQGKTSSYTYGRQSNPSVRDLESKINCLEEAYATVAFSSGMAAIGSSLFALLSAGDHIIVSKFLFGNTRSLFCSFKKFGIAVDFVDTTDSENVEKLVRKKTVALFVETIANPLTQIPDMVRLGALCQDQGLLFIVDNTLTSPSLFNPKAVGASLVINSLSKYICGNGSSLGGTVSDTGIFDWSNFNGIDGIYKNNYNPKDLCKMQISKKGLRDFGASISPDSANLICFGLETLDLRVHKICENANKIAAALKDNHLVANVYHPSLYTHRQHSVANELYGSYGGVLSFDLSASCDLHAFFSAIKNISISSHLADLRTLIIPVAQTIFFEVGGAARTQMGISDQTIRLSVGIEPAQEVIEYLEEAIFVSKN